MKKQLGVLAIVGSLLLGVFAIAPTATAHYCKAYEGCDASNCPEGEYHDHTDQNYVARDEQCKSEEASGCEYNDVELPRAVCNLIEICAFSMPMAKAPEIPDVEDIEEGDLPEPPADSTLPPLPLCP